MPLVLALHGWGGAGWVIELGSGFSTKADQEGFLVVYPNAGNLPTMWNYGFGPSNADPEQDIAFFHQLLDELEAEFNLASDRLFLAGISDGGCMAHFLGSALSGRLRAVAVVGGAVGSYKYEELLMTPPPKYPVSMLILHGLRDRFIPYDGGPWGTAAIPWTSVEQAVGFWVTVNGCDPKPTRETSRDGRVITDTYAGGVKGAVVQLCTLRDWGHEWFQRPQFNATNVIWEFFASLP